MIEYLPLVLTGLGLTASIVYYTNVLQNANKTQQIQLETRQAQFFMQLSDKFNSPEANKTLYTVHKLEWDDYEDYLKKTNENKEISAAVFTILGSFESFGIMLKNGFIDANLLADFAAYSIIKLWEKYPLLEFRERNGNPSSWVNFEYLYHEMKKLRPYL